MHYKRIVLNSRPVADIEPTTFRTETLSLSDLKPGVGEVLVQITWLSLDPAMRGYIRDARSYLPPVQIGETMRAMGLGVVVQAGSQSKFSVGEQVTGAFGWTEFAVMKDKNVDKVTVPKGVQSIDFLNTLGTSGLTAYFGLRDICDLKPGDKMVVSGAAGSVGSIACQLGKRAGATVYAIAGSQDKCEWLEKEIGVDKAFNYKSPTFRQDFKEAGYIDVFFDNVGGDILDMVLTRLNKGARIALCGAISQYNATKPKGLQNYQTLISMRAKIHGFIILDYTKEFPAAIEEMARGLVDGSIKRKFHIVEGLEQAPVALPMLFSGGNTGKLVVKVSEEPKAKL
ncbi:alcohol dehydrogenase [Mycena albidolilacea]|uniref:Alcohol dehydrogenase n=1 Tax=Mycena albidolilacea TaxID=1033008 RepID=A0AAD7F1V6_9AGAR|nr:alcohol dehydrogenase [Mycena albidolilacea]